MKNINCQTLKKWLENNEAVVVDVREPAEHEAEKISGSHLIPLGNINKNLLPECGNKKLVLHCRSGKRSTSACQKLLEQDPNLEIYNLEGGISAWIESGCAIKSSNKFFLPLDRQVQLTIGIFVLVGSLLGYFYNPKFFILSGFFGAGLIFAGLSGTCALASVIAKMPWNKSCQKTNFCTVSKS